MLVEQPLLSVQAELVQSGHVVHQEAPVVDVTIAGARQFASGLLFDVTRSAMYSSAQG